MTSLQFLESRMNLLASMIETYEFNRGRTLATLERLAKLETPQALAWRPGPDRAHVAWQLMHIAITEDIFAAERLPSNQSPTFPDLWPAYRGGSQPAEPVPSLPEIRETLDRSRESLLAALGGLDESDLETIPESLRERGWTIRQVLHIISWHETHHQGQAHLTLNLYENRL